MNEMPLSMLDVDPQTVRLEDVDVSQAELFFEDRIGAFFERLRREDPVHYCPHSQYGPYWSVTKFHDIKQVDTNHEVFSSDRAITIEDEEGDFETPMFIAMDPPRHDAQRKEVNPVVAPPNLKKLEGTIRERAGRILDALPRGETFNWVDLVSIELTTQMLATLFDFPFEDRHKLTRWSDVGGTGLEAVEFGVVDTEAQRRAELLECLEYFTRLWKVRANQPPGNDLISMLAHGESTRDMPPMEFLGNLILLIVGGNDTTRNSISGGVLALNQHPAEYEKLKANPGLIANMVSEIIRYQTPLAHMRRTATMDIEFGGKQIRAGDKVIMWYLSGNRDETAIERPNEFLIDRRNARQHLSFGFGIHRCMGNRLAEMQLRVLWEEILERFSWVEVVGEPVRVRSNFIHGFSELPVRVHPL